MSLFLHSATTFSVAEGTPVIMKKQVRTQTFDIPNPVTRSSRIYVLLSEAEPPTSYGEVRLWP